MSDTSRHTPGQRQRRANIADAAAGIAEEMPPDAEPGLSDGQLGSDPHAELLARLRARNAASESNYRVKSGELP
ncbi:hypothetical protein [Streptomyces profundus]|uniref:hypothetical protein n=1 Tax=Streptomyces profundus TaxID=2867410 RepID=UPI001D169B84|nr:hypothetical protein [Streptomyces sp. MA3_2.13]UED87427.1 hypothetical protein K4G22_27095 [Streptomyces sp. MA3_2.13]